MMKSVAVYCGHQFGADPAFARDAKKTGELLARNRIRMVFGGGAVGLMGAVASSAIDNGGEVIGVTTPHVVALQEPPHQGAKIQIVAGVNERKQRMFELSDAFCILPGGMGTLNELTDIVTMQQIGETKKPIYFLNTGKYWNIFGRIFIHMQNSGFIASMDDYNMLICNTPEEMVGSLAALSIDE
jgi:uncharacterized protein (TIGR00730 family)